MQIYKRVLLMINNKIGQWKIKCLKKSNWKSRVVLCQIMNYVPYLPQLSTLVHLNLKRSSKNVTIYKLELHWIVPETQQSKVQQYLRWNLLDLSRKHLQHLRPASEGSDESRWTRRDRHRQLTRFRR